MKKTGFISHLLRGNRRSEKLETSSNSTIFTVGPSVSSSSSALSSVVPLSPASMNGNVKSPSSAHDSTISRLIDAVSLDNDQDTCGSISVLIGQLEDTVDQNSSKANYVESRQSPLLNLKPTTPKEFKSPLENNSASPHKKQPHCSQRPDQIRALKIHKSFSPCSISQSASPAPALLSSPETAEIEEVYTILDEEVLLPVSVYNLKKQTVHIQADTMEHTPSSSSGSSPTKMAHSVRKEQAGDWNSADRLQGATIDQEDLEERVYEEVHDFPPSPLTDLDFCKHTSSSTNDCFSPHNYKAFAEVEVNVDEDPAQNMLISPRRDALQKELQSPTKRFAIYQNHNFTPTYAYQRSPSTYCTPQHQYSKHSSQAAFSPRQSPINKASNSYLYQGSFQPSVHHRTTDLTRSNPSPSRQNSYPLPQCKSESLSNGPQFRCPFNSQPNFNRGEITDQSQHYRKGFKPKEVGFFQNGFSSAESLSSQLSNNFIKDRGPMSPSLDSEAVYSLPHNTSFMPLPDPPASFNTQPHTQGTMHFNASRHLQDQASLDVNAIQHNRVETKVAMDSKIKPAHLQTHPTESTSQSPCKSKSLGDLTSEDISCNFQSKYHIISRSFITPHMKKQKMLGRVGGGALQSHSSDPLTEQLRRLVTLEGEEFCKERPLSPQRHEEAKYSMSQPQAASVSPAGSRDVDDSPPLLTRRLSSRSQSRVRNINNRARERQQEALKPRAAVSINSTASIGSVILRNKPASQNQQANRHSTGSYIAGYFSELEDRGLPEGACTSLRYGNVDCYGDQFYTDDTLTPVGAAASEPEVYFLLRL